MGRQFEKELLVTLKSIDSTLKSIEQSLSVKDSNNPKEACEVALRHILESYQKTPTAPEEILKNIRLSTQWSL